MSENHNSSFQPGSENSFESCSKQKWAEEFCDRVRFSNQVWWPHCKTLPIDIVDCCGEKVGSPSLTSFHDFYSSNVMGVHLALALSLGESLALALRQAILRKQHFDQNASKFSWSACGLPKSLLFYDDESFSQMTDLCRSLSIPIYLATFLKLQERVKAFDANLLSLLSRLPGYRNTNQHQSKPCLTLPELEQIVWQFVVHDYNQQICPEGGQFTRSQRWELGCGHVELEVPSERSLDVCLPRSDLRLVHRNGRVYFAGQTYRDEALASHIGEQVFVRFNPRNITTVLVFQQHGDEDIFLARACILNFQEERLLLEDAKAIDRAKRKQLKAHKSID